MCGIAGAISLTSEEIPDLQRRLAVMTELQRHRGPDGEGLWVHPRKQVGLGHRRLSIIDLDAGTQPMEDSGGNWITHSGEVYNYIELRRELGSKDFNTTSDTEVILRAYRKWGPECVNHFRGMFSFALWDEEQRTLFCARDRFGIKPFYYMRAGGVFYFASEIKALLPFTDRIETDLEGLKDYLTLQFCLEGKTLFKGIHELHPAHTLRVHGDSIEAKRYWEVHYDLDFGRSAEDFEEELRSLLEESVELHLRSDVPLGATMSGGMDSSAIASLAARKSKNGKLVGFTGKFSSYGPQYDESSYAREVAEWLGIDLFEVDITAADFIEHIQQVIYHMDFPAAGPGSFSQFMVSRLASRHRKVVLGGHGGDEIFGGYTRYLIAYFEQCIKGAIEGTMHDGNFIVTYESIIPNLTALRSYKPLLKDFWSEGLFEDMDKRYFRLVDRARGLKDEVRWDLLGDYSPFETFKGIFNGGHVRKESYFDLMTHFDFKTLLPALLHVEDRTAGAHGLESRVPFLDHPLVELAATIPSNIKFKDGTLKHCLSQLVRPFLPEVVVNRKEKMGFPTPLTAWIQGEAHDFTRDVLSTASAQSRALFDNARVLEQLDSEPVFGRKIWGFLCLEIWQQQFHDREGEFKRRLKDS